MKPLFALIACLGSLVAAPALSAAESAPKASADSEVLLKGAGPMFPAHGGLAGKFTYLNGQGFLLFGGIGSLVIGDHWGVGVGSYSLSTEYSNAVLGVQNDVSFSYGGVIFDTSWSMGKLIFYNFGTLFGVGFGTATPRVQGAARARSSFVLAEPELKANINLTQEARLAVGISYRFTGGADNGAILGMGLDGPSMTLQILYGKI